MGRPTKKKRKKKKKTKRILESPAQTRDVLSAAETGDVLNLKHILLNPDRQVNLNGGCADALTLAAEGGFEECIVALLEAGADPNVKGGKALLKASAGGHAGIVAALLKFGSQPNKASEFSEYAPLHFAAEAGCVGAVLALVSFGADVEVRTHEENCGQFSSWTPLHFAADGGHLDCVQALIAAMSPVDLRTAAGNTACALAAEHGRFDVVRFLAAADADISATRRGLNVLQWAVYRCDCDAIEYLCSYGAFADLTVTTRWFAEGTSGRNATLAQQIKRDVSPPLIARIDRAIYRGGKKFHLRAAHEELLREVEWTQADDDDALDPVALAMQAEALAKHTYVLPEKAVTLIAAYEL
jgi:hypothetical protein